MTKRERLHKGAVNGLARRRLTVASYLFGTQPLVELRILNQDHDRTDQIDLTIPQARETARLLSAAIEAAANSACHDRNPKSSEDRASFGEGPNDVGERHYTA